jgi:hypothetical protein
MRVAKSRHLRLLLLHRDVRQEGNRCTQHSIVIIIVIGLFNVAVSVVKLQISYERTVVNGELTSYGGSDMVYFKV